MVQYFKDFVLLIWSESTAAEIYFTLWSQRRCCQAVAPSNWCSDLHSTDCPRGAVGVSDIPPLAGRQPAVEGPELLQVDGQWRPEEIPRGQDSVSAQPGLSDRRGSVHLHLLADGGGLRGRRLHHYGRGGARRGSGNKRGPRRRQRGAGPALSLQHPPPAQSPQAARGPRTTKQRHTRAGHESHYGLRSPLEALWRWTSHELGGGKNTYLNCSSLFQKASLMSLCALNKSGLICTIGWKSIFLNSWGK